VPGSAGATAAGAANQIQYNDGAGGLAASSDFTVDLDWNDAAVTFTGLKLNVTDTASLSDSKLLDLQSGGTSQLSVTSGGVVRSNAFYVSPTTNNGIVNGSGATLSLRRAGIEYLNIGTNALTVRDGTNLVFNTITGTKIGTATNQKLGFYNATPVVQPTTAVSSATVVGGGGTAVDDATTFNGYTLAQVVQALQNLGILA
jgi:hypothetical protein